METDTALGQTVIASQPLPSKLCSSAEATVPSAQPIAAVLETEPLPNATQEDAEHTKANSGSMGNVCKTEFASVVIDIENDLAEAMEQPNHIVLEEYQDDVQYIGTCEIFALLVLTLLLLVIGISIYLYVFV
ncbi:hypothetical protein L596_000919 [Steinernema carpocapsae]|uniref:Uncharacterized protein n=1 Tax=Steinernema carpocapsae TaxID=34508 RepID=A0A4U8ULU1_STECR|nr:hypothetical protein L596_000919 [Steinernema carpocapsae]